MNQTSSIYKNKLNLLVSGYSFENTGKEIPVSLINLISTKHTPEEPKLTLDVVDTSNPVHLQCFFNGTLNKLMNITEYK